MIENLINEIDKYKVRYRLDAIVVEGYDGVGKGRILSELSRYYEVSPYRPDYNLWQMFDHRKVDRWKVSGFFWDIYSYFYKGCVNLKPMLFDRGVISGAVYNNDMRIADHYKEMIRAMNIMHILVTCSLKDYTKFYRARHSINDISIEGIAEEWEKYMMYTERYLEALERSGVDYIVYENKYDDNIDQSICCSCGHYSYGVCRHPNKNCQVDGNQKRCELSNEKEVQDIDSEVYSLQS